MAFTRKRAQISAVISAAALVAGLFIAPVHWPSLGIAAVVGGAVGLLQVKYRDSGAGVLIVSLLVLTLSRRLSASAFKLREAEGLTGSYLLQFYGLAMLVMFALLLLVMRQKSRAQA